MSALQQAAALVARPVMGQAAAASYLQVAPGGEPVWVADPQAATPFASMREAARMALRLPANLRAYGLPRQAELSVHKAH